MPYSPPPASSVLQGRSRARRLLVVDDNRDCADAQALLLEMLGHDVSTAYNGARAVEAVATERPDVLLLDLEMAGMDGVAVLQSLRRLGIAIPTLIITGNPRSPRADDALRAGARHIFTKPVRIAQLMDAIERAVPVEATHAA